MPNTLVLSSLAEMELKESYDWYEAQQQGLGERFLSYVEDSIASISNHPESYPVKVGPYRQYVVAVFPFVIVYEFVPDKRLVYILHVFHTSQKPDKKLRK